MVKWTSVILKTSKAKFSNSEILRERKIFYLLNAENHNTPSQHLNIENNTLFFISLAFEVRCEVLDSRTEVSEMSERRKFLFKYSCGENFGAKIPEVKKSAEKLLRIRLFYL